MQNAVFAALRMIYDCQNAFLFRSAAVPAEAGRRFPEAAQRQEIPEKSVSSKARKQAGYKIWNLVLRGSVSSR